MTNIREWMQIVEAALPDPLDFMEHLQAASDAAGAGFWWEEGGCWGMALALYDRLRAMKLPAKLVVSYLENSPSHAFAEFGGKLYDYTGETQVGDGDRRQVIVTPAQLIQIAKQAGHDRADVLAAKEDAAEIINSVIDTSGITEAAMLREASERRFYHSSDHALTDGTILVPQANNRVSKWYEKRLELNKPAKSLSRSEAVFMVDDVLMLPGVGAALAYVYEVQPLGKTERHDANWLIHMQGSQPDDADSLARSYWRGTATGEPMWEYLTPRARIVRFAFDYDEESGQFEPQS